MLARRQQCAAALAASTRCGLDGRREGAHRSPSSSDVRAAAPARRSFPSRNFAQRRFVDRCASLSLAPGRTALGGVPRRCLSRRGAGCVKQPQNSPLPALESARACSGRGPFSALWPQERAASTASSPQPARLGIRPRRGGGVGMTVGTVGCREHRIAREARRA
jgi:hypothetical protein